jgi:hypothetical protein
MNRASIVRIFVVIGLSAFLSGCFPVAYTYWRPAADQGNVINPHEGHIMTADTLEVQANAARVRFWSNGKLADIIVRIPEGSSAVFLSNEVVLKKDNSARVFKFESIQNGSTQKELLPTDVMVGGKLYTRLFGGDVPLSYYVRIEFGYEETTSYIIKPPAIKVDDQIFEMPQIEFHKSTGVGIASP